MDSVARHQDVAAMVTAAASNGLALSGRTMLSGSRLLPTLRPSIGQRNGGLQQEAVGRGFCNQLVVGGETSGLAQFGGKRDDSALGDGKYGFRG